MAPSTVAITTCTMVVSLSWYRNRRRERSLYRGVGEPPRHFPIYLEAPSSTDTLRVLSCLLSGVPEPAAGARR